MRTILILVAAIAMLSGCDLHSAEEKQYRATRELSREAEAQTGMPGIVNFQERKLVKRIYELRDREKLLTYTYIVDLNGRLHFLTRSLGYGLPYGVQFTSPERWAGTGITLPQPEPNGLYMPASAEGTWIMALDPKGEAHPVYVEPRIIVSPFQMKTESQ